MVAALVTLIASGGKPTLRPAAGSWVLGWEPRQDEKWVEGQKDPDTVVWRGDKEHKQTRWQHGGEEGLEQTYRACLMKYCSSTVLHSREGWDRGQHTK